MRTAEAVSLLFILFCRDPQFSAGVVQARPCVVPQVH